MPIHFGAGARVGGGDLRRRAASARSSLIARWRRCRCWPGSRTWRRCRWRCSTAYGNPTSAMVAGRRGGGSRRTAPTASSASAAAPLTWLRSSARWPRRRRCSNTCGDHPPGAAIVKPAAARFGGAAHHQRHRLRGSAARRWSAANDTHVKAQLSQPKILARAVFADPELTLALPPAVTAATNRRVDAQHRELPGRPGTRMCDGIARRFAPGRARLATAVARPTTRLRGLT